MEPILNDVEVRVIGALIEKQVTTPEYYPLTLNALVHACNQIQNRDPVVSYDEATVARALESLRVKYFAHVIYARENRVEKYRQVLTEKFELGPPGTAVLCVLLLRGPQTVGELRGRTQRLHEFRELAEVEETLEQLMQGENVLVARLPRQPGQKEARYTHLLAGPPAQVEEAPAAVRAEPAMQQVRGENERVKQLEDEVAAVKSELQVLREQFETFRKQFE